VAHALARQGSLPEWGGVLVERQTHGRGQLARRWESPPGNVYAALRLPLAYPLDTAAAAPALGGLTAEALRRMGYAVWCKWPNDILQVIHEEINDGEQGNAAVRPGNVWRKVGGILLEERGGALIAGMGFNLAGSPGASLLRKKFSFPAGCLEAPTPEKTPASLIAWWIRLAGEIFSCYSSPIVAASDVFWWPALAEKHLAFRGSLVRVCDTAPDSAQEGILEGLCASGALRLRTASGSMTFSGGTVVPVTSAEGVRGA
jgi:BirA family biotin operon repressor/biotin-[acetyl-CoA-carboxylase] ligase